MESDDTSIAAEQEAEVAIESGAPPVVAVVVTCNPGSWFTETLESLRDQTYPNLAILVIDAASADDPLPVIAEVLPDCYVRRLGRNPGYAAASNRTLRVVQGASHLLFCHDDVVLAPDVISKLVEAAIRENAGVVAPKLVDWDNPSLLQDLGGTTDETGVYLPAIEPGDLDQGQHDVGGEVFAARGGCLLVRADLFAALGGFDPSMTQYGEDLDFCWRAQIAGARVVTAPNASVRHLEAGTRGLRAVSNTVVDLQHRSSMTSDDDDGAPLNLAVDDLVLRQRHRLRTVLKVCTTRRSLPTIVRLIALTIGELLFDIVTGRGRRAGALVAMWTWNVAHVRETWRLRRQVQRLRVVPDKELDARLGSTRGRVAATVRHVLETRRERLTSEMHGRELAGVLRNLPVAVWGTIAVLWLIGSRHLLAGSLPALGVMVPFPDSPIDPLKAFAAMVPGDGFGEATTHTPANLVVGLLGVGFLGATGLLQKVLVLGMLPLGVWGMWRLTRQLGSPRGRLFAVLAYAVVPLPYDSLIFGRWDALVAYAAAPFLLSRVLRAHGSEPYRAKRGLLRLSFRKSPDAADEDDFETLTVADLSSPTAAMLLSSRAEGDVEVVPVETAHDEARRDRVWFLAVRRVFPLALMLGLAGAFAPQLVSSVVVIAASLVIGSLLMGEDADRLRTLAVTVAAGLIAMGLLLPGIIGSDDGWSMFWSHLPSAHEPDSLVALLQFHTGGAPTNLATLGLLVAALPGVLLGRGWRMHLSVRLWIITFAFVMLTWAGRHEWLGPITPDPHTFLAMAAAATALNVALGVLVMQEDLSSYRFGWRQLTPFVAVAGVVLAVLPVAARAGDGSWDLPRIGQDELLSWMDDRNEPGSFRVLWLGDADAMPGGSRQMATDLAAAVSTDGPVPHGVARPGLGGDGQLALADAIERARAAETVQLGRLLAPHAIRYVVVPHRTGPTSSGGIDVPVPPGIDSMLAAQLDLRSVIGDSSMSVYENNEWAPLRHMQSPAAVVASHNGDKYAAQSVSMKESTPVLDHRSHGASFSGQVESGEVFVSQAASSAWRLSVDGSDQKLRTSFGWAASFEVPAGGRATLRYDAPAWIGATQFAVAVAWVLLFATALRHRTRRGRFS